MDDPANRPLRVKKVKIQELESDSSYLPPKKYKKKKIAHVSISPKISPRNSTSPRNSPRMSSPTTAPSTSSKTVSYVSHEDIEIMKVKKSVSKNGGTLTFKRPRGRPPLPSNRYKFPNTYGKLDNLISKNSSANVPSSSGTNKEISSKSSYYKSGIKNIQKVHKVKSEKTTNKPSHSYKGSNKVVNSTKEKNQNLESIKYNTKKKNIEPKPIIQSSQPVVIGIKNIRPSGQFVTKRVLCYLMTNEPISVTELTKVLIDVPRDLLQAVLDVLRVMGIIIQLKVKEPINTLTDTVYTITEFGRTSSPIDLTEIEEEIAKKINCIKEIENRNKELYELTYQEDLSNEERINVLRELIKKFTSQNPNLSDDPLYSDIISKIGKK